MRRMNATGERSGAEVANGATNEDQPAEAATQAAEPAGAAAAEPEAAPLPSPEAEQEKAESKPRSPKAKGSPAKAKAREPVQSEEKPSGRRERKQTAFFQPEKKSETEKLEIREVGSTSIPVSTCFVTCTGEDQADQQHLTSGTTLKRLHFRTPGAAVTCRAKALNLARFQMVSPAPCTSRLAKPPTDAALVVQLHSIWER